MNFNVPYSYLVYHSMIVKKSIYHNFKAYIYPQKTKEGWREILVDIDSANEESNEFRYVISRSATPACQIFNAKVIIFVLQ